MELFAIADIITKGITVSLILMTLISIALVFRFDKIPYRIPVYLFIALLFDITGLVLGKLYGYNLFVTPLFGLVDYFIWSRFFILKKSKERKQLIWMDLLLLTYMLFELFHLSEKKGFLVIPGASLANLFIIIVMIYSYWKIYRIESGINWSIYSFVFVYASFNCFFYLFLNFSVYWNDEYKFFLWLSHSVLLHLFYFFLPYYQWKIGKNPQHFLFG